MIELTLFISLIHSTRFNNAEEYAEYQTVDSVLLGVHVTMHVD